MLSDKMAVALVLLTCAMIGGVFHIKYMAVSLEDNIKKTKRAIKQYKKDYCILQAEWQALTNPDRIQILSDKYLASKMEPAKAINVPIDGFCSACDEHETSKLVDLITEYEQ